MLPWFSDSLPHDCSELLDDSDSVLHSELNSLSESSLDFMLVSMADSDELVHDVYFDCEEDSMDSESVPDEYEHSELD